ncbi:sensor histidine kinase [Schleiferilactobacillus perolens]|jgi:signal transduction histidine kinase|uniref:sensor histidine kinase n=1 Tax=Schleiferilactobacillus perolens TaxID=100468 RepID=UPI0023568802|nr:HAMP domain-containing sensor histidine kinase [Schleiferilactobacillus perolens]MCI2171695.1 HAMP domain-containing histidine kinase [Schleiferilactobacillus perolens]
MGKNKSRWWWAPETRSAIILASGLWVFLALCSTLLWWLTNVHIGVLVAILILAAVLLLEWAIWWSRRVGLRLAAANAQLDAAVHGRANYAITLNDEGLFSQLNNQIFHYVRQTESLRADLQRDRDHLTQAITDIAHQLRTPIATIENLSELLTPANASTSQAELLRQNARLAQLVEQLILLARVDTHTLSQEKQNISVDELLKSALNPLLPLISAKDLAIDWQVPEQLTVRVNPALFREALVNVFKNASEHAPAHSTVTVNTTDNPLVTTLAITNQGPAIAAADLPHIFERFYRGAQSNPHNVGIGLAIAAGITQASDGRLQVANTDAGVTFTFSLYK